MKDEAPISAAPPPIPACRKAQRWNPRLHMLAWTHTGRAFVRVAGGEQYQVDEGCGIWLPAGEDHEMWTEPGSLVIPAWVSPYKAAGAPTDVLRFAVTEAWRDWLIYLYVQMIAPMAGPENAEAEVLAMLQNSSSAPRQGGLRRIEREGQLSLPRSAAARTVAQQLLHDPGLEHSVEDWAALVSSSPRTLRRQFVSETGLAFAEWRTFCRLFAAREFLDAGYDIGHAAVLAGFGTRNGFTRAFRHHHGMTPRDYVGQMDISSRSVSPRVVGAQYASTIGDLARWPAVPRRPLPAMHSAPRVNDFNVLVWTYRGEATARIGERIYRRAEGDALWLPAGVENETRTLEGSLGVPIGEARPDELLLPRPLRARFPASWETYLLYCSVSAYHLLRPDNYNPLEVLEIFNEQLAAERARTVPLPGDARARAVAHEFIRRISKETTARDWEVSREVDDAFRRETGMGFAVWRRSVRMRLAREHLRNGAKPSSVARRVGYSQLSNFSRDFTRIHGVSPRHYQAEESDQG